MTWALLVSVLAHAGAAWYWVDWTSTGEAVGDPARDTLVVVRLLARATVPAPPVSPTLQSQARSLRAPPITQSVPVAAKAVSQPASPRQVVPAPTAQRVAADLTPATAIPSPAAVTTDAPRNPRAREAYRLRLMRHIETHKFYPAAARRYRRQGDVKVQLEVDCGGVLADYELEGGLAQLLHAARRALLSARPLPVPPAESCPQTVRYVMQYRLQ